MSDDLRAAAERVRKSISIKGVFPWDTDAYANWNRPAAMYQADCADLAKAYAREHPADDATEIDGDWLVAVGATKDDHPAKWTFHRQDAMDIGLWHVDDGWKAMLIQSERAASCIVRGLKTRGDVRRLAQCLGIELKEPTQ